MPNPEAMKEIEAFRERMARKAVAIEVARMSLHERVREFVDKYGRGPKAGRPDYSIVTLDKIEPMRIALDEYDRVRATPAPADP